MLHPTIAAEVAAPWTGQQVGTGEVASRFLMMFTTVGTTAEVVALSLGDVCPLFVEESPPVTAAMTWTVQEVPGMTEEDDKRTVLARTRFKRPPSHFTHFFSNKSSYTNLKCEPSFLWPNCSSAHDKCVGRLIGPPWTAATNPTLFLFICLLCTACVCCPAWFKLRAGNLSLPVLHGTLFCPLLRRVRHIGAKPPATLHTYWVCLNVCEDGVTDAHQRLFGPPSLSRPNDSQTKTTFVYVDLASFSLVFCVLLLQIFRQSTAHFN